MKKFLSILLVAMLVVTCLATAVFATGGEATVSVSSVSEAVRGKEYTVTYSVKGTFANFELMLEADEDLTLVGIGGNDEIEANLIVGSPKFGKVTFARGENVKSGVVTFTATYKVAEDADCGALKVSAKVLFVSDRDLVDQATSVNDGSISVAHKWDNGKVTTKPTCTDPGVKTYTCEVCAATKTESIPANGHQHGNLWEIVKNPTCTEPGLKVKDCNVCGEVAESEEIPALGHSWDDGVVVTPATCEATGVMKYTCNNDASHTKTETIPALGHAWDDGVVLTPATCEETGVVKYTCKNDASHTKTETIPALGHAYELADAKEATCTEDGYEKYVCKNDASHTKTVVLPAYGHDWCEDFDCEYDHDHYDDDNHWYLCMNCGEKKDVEAHDHSVENNGYLFCKCGHWVEVEDPAKDDEPSMGDNTLELTLGFTAIVALMAVAAYALKRKQAE